MFHRTTGDNYLHVHIQNQENSFFYTKNKKLQHLQIGYNNIWPVDLEIDDMVNLHLQLYLLHVCAKSHYTHIHYRERKSYTI